MTPERQVAALVQALEQDQTELAKYFQPEGVLDALDYDDQQIIHFMVEDIAFQAYSGVLRGIEGTLASRAGNAHDQALALAALLRDAGYEAQIARAELTVDQAKLLNGSISRSKFDSPPPSSAAAGPLNAAIKAVKAHQLAPEVPLNEANRAANALLKALPQSDMQAMASPMLANIAHASRSYRWVRYRGASGDAWQDVHPAYPKAAQWQLQFEALESEQIDPKDLQRVSIELWIEDSSGQQTMVGKNWTAPAANLHNRPIELSIQSNALLQTKLFNRPEELFANSQYFFITIDGTPSNSDLIFDLQGKTYPMSALQGLNSVFATMNEKGQQATGALQGLGGNGAEEESRLQRVWINFGISKPGTNSDTRVNRVIRRDLYQHSDGLTNADVAQKLLQQWIIDTSTSDYAPHYYQHKQALQFREQIDGYQRFMAGLARAEAAGTLNTAEIAEGYASLLQDPAYARLPYLRSAFGFYADDPEIVQYTHEPSLLAIRSGFLQRGGAVARYQMTDIISNSQLAFTKNASGLIPNPASNIRRGVWETRAEAFRLGGSAEALNQQSAFAVLSEARNLTRTRIADNSEDTLNLASSESSESWWQLDEQTGSAIGMHTLAPGQGGSEMVEEILFTAIAWAFAGALFIIGTSSCIEGGGDVSCCVGSNAALSFTAFMTSVCIGLVGMALGAGWGLGVTSSLAIDLGLTQVTVRCGGSA